MIHRYYQLGVFLGYYSAVMTELLYLSLDLLLRIYYNSSRMRHFLNSSRKSKQDFYCEKRKRQRVKCTSEAKFIYTNQSIYSCKIVDMSESGVAISSSADLEVGGILNFIRPAMEVEVIWTLENKAGLKIVS